MTTQTLEPTQTATVVGQRVHIPGFGYGTITGVIKLNGRVWAVIESSGFCHPMRYAVRLENAEALAREQNHWTPEADYVIQLAEKAISQPPSVTAIGEVTTDQYQQIFSALVAERVGHQVANRKLAVAYDLAQARIAELESEHFEQSLAVTDLLPYKGVVEGIRAICDEAYGEHLHIPVYDLVYGLGKTFKKFIALHKVNFGLEMELHKLITALDAERERNAVLVDRVEKGMQS